MRPRSRQSGIAAASAVLAVSLAGGCEDEAHEPVHEQDVEESSGDDALPGDLETDGEEVGATPLSDPSAWSQVAADVDPFVTAGDDPDVCPASDSHPEETPDGTWFEVRTDGCAWYTGSQPLLAAVPAGASVRITLVHGEVLAGDEDYTVSIALGDPPETVWTRAVPLETGDETLEETVAVAGDHDAGAPIWFHLSNHGENTWSLAGIDLLGSERAACGTER